MSRTIMIVDDEPMITTTLATLVRIMMKQEVAVFNDPREALQAVALGKGGIDLIVSDFLMPGMNGVEFLKKARELAPEAITVMLTGYADKENAIRSINEVGLYHYVEKPWDNTQLVTILNNGLEKKAMAEQLARRMAELQQANGELERSRQAIERLYSMVRAEYDSELEQTKGVLVALANTIEAKDPYTDGHTRGVMSWSRLLGTKLGLDKERLDRLLVAAELHDVGKVSVPESILNKPGRLTTEEFDIIARHPATGEEILRPLGSLNGCLDAIRHHHEKLDGSGYPDRLTGDAISLEARILCVADIFHALHTTRPYHEQFPLGKSLAILREEADAGKLDAAVVTALIEVICSGEADALLAEMK